MSLGSSGKVYPVSEPSVRLVVSTSNSERVCVICDSELNPISTPHSGLPHPPGGLKLPITHDRDMWSLSPLELIQLPKSTKPFYKRFWGALGRLARRR